MNACNLHTEEFDEIYQMHREISEMHHQVTSTLQMIVAALDELRACDQGTRSLVEGLSVRAASNARAKQAPTACPTCGSRLHHHKAEAGELLICTACGWSEFVDLAGDPHDELASLPPLANGPQSGPWAVV